MTGSTNYTITDETELADGKFEVTMSADAKGSDEAETVSIKLINRDDVEQTISMIVSEAAIDAPAITSITESTEESVGTLNTSIAYGFEFTNSTSEVTATFDMVLPTGTFVDNATSVNGDDTKYTIVLTDTTITLTMLEGVMGTDDMVAMTIGLKNNDGEDATVTFNVSEAKAETPEVTAIVEITDPAVGSLTALDAAQDYTSYFSFNPTTADAVVATFEVTIDDALTLGGFASSANFEIAAVDSEAKQFAVTMATPTPTAEEISFTVSNVDGEVKVYTIQAGMAEAEDVVVGAVSLVDAADVASLDGNAVKFGSYASSSTVAQLQLPIDSGYIEIPEVEGVIVDVADASAGTFNLAVSAYREEGEPKDVTINIYKADGVLQESVVLNVSWDSYLYNISLTDGSGTITPNDTAFDIAYNYSAYEELSTGTSTLKFTIDNIESDYVVVTTSDLGVTYTTAAATIATYGDGVALLTEACKGDGFNLLLYSTDYTEETISYPIYVGKSDNVGGYTDIKSFEINITYPPKTSPDVEE